MASSTPQSSNENETAISSITAAASSTPAQSKQNGGDEIYITPPNRGTACTAEYRTEAIIDAIKSGILEDIKKREECEVEPLFCVLLRIIAQKTDDSPENKEWAEDCLDKCLDAATKFVNDKDNRYTRLLHSSLKDYCCNATCEADRYPGTASALNAILRHFRSLVGQQDLPVDLQVPNSDELRAPSIPNQ